MKRFAIAILALCLSTTVHAEGVVISDAYIPIAPPAAKAHAAYMTIANEGTGTRKLISVTAKGYHMAHLHMTVKKDGVSSMASMHHMSIEPGQEIVLTPGKMHIMLMKPMKSLKEGNKVKLMLNFANGETFPVIAVVKSRRVGHDDHDGQDDHNDHHGHDDHTGH